MKRGRRSQAAMEFLLTYGWAILVVIVVIGALSYFGVLNPQKLIPEQCTFGPGIGKCADFEVTRTMMTLSIMNGFGEPITITEIKNSGCANAVFSPGIIIEPAGKGTLIITGCNFAPGKKVKAELELVYVKGKSGTGLSHTLSGSISADVKAAGTGSVPAGCNDGTGTITGTEVCDGNNFGVDTCETLGYEAGTLLCSQDCSYIDTSGCHPIVCSDNIVDTGEDCEGNVGTNTCADVGFDGGNLGCYPTTAQAPQVPCTFDTSGCYKCGDGTVNPGEECDDGNTVPGDGCANNCQISGLMAFYPMNLNANDYSGNNRNGAVTGAALTDGGRYGKAYSFDGIDDYITVPFNPSAVIGNGGPFSISVWIKPVTPLSGTHFIAGDAVSGTSRFVLYQANDKVMAGLGDRRDLFFNTGISLAAGTWTHLVLVYDGSPALIYKNAGTPYTYTFTFRETYSATFLVGRVSFYGTSYYFNGAIDEVRIYNRALTPAEINIIMNFDSSKMVIP